MSLIKSYQAYLIKPIFDKGLSPTGTSDEVWRIAWILVGVGFIHYFFRYFQGWGLKTCSEQIAIDLRRRLFHKILYLPYETFKQKKVGDLSSIVTSDVKIYSDITNDIFIVVREILMIFGLLFVAFYHDVQLTLMCLGVVPVYYFVFNFVGEPARKWGQKVRGTFGEVSNEVLQGLEGVKVIRSFGAQKFFLGRLIKLHDKYIDGNKKIFSIQENASPLIEFLGLLVFSFILVMGNQKIQSGEMSLGALLSFLASIALVIDPVRRLTRSLVFFRTWSGASDRIFGLLEEYEENLRQEKQEAKYGDIEIHNLTFSFGESQVLKGVDINIKKGEKIALVGASGGGKSLMTHLLINLYEVKSGEIKIDGQDINEYSKTSLRNLIAYVGQDVTLFHDTLKNNIILDKEYDEEKFKKVISESLVEEFLETLTSGVETILGDRGTQISGGQAQRVSIARALYLNAPILIFDEATSALDNKLDKEIQEMIKSEFKNRILITVAHKLNTIQDYDRIYFLDSGKIIEKGSHQELMALKGQYFSYYSVNL